MRTRHLNVPLIVAGFLTSTAPLFAQAQQPDMAKLKADAQKVVSIISGDKAKLQIYCQINDLEDQIGEADQQKDRKKAEALAEKVDELEKQLGPEYLALVDATMDVEPNSKEDEEIESLFEKLDDSCPD
jgi:5'-3' exonuclease